MDFDCKKRFMNHKNFHILKLWINLWNVFTLLKTPFFWGENIPLFNCQQLMLLTVVWRVSKDIPATRRENKE